MRKKLDTRFPAARIKKIMQADEDVGKIAMAVPVLVSKALELFLQDLCDRTYDITLRRGAKTLNSLHLRYCVQSYNVYDFLREIVGKVPDYGHSDVAAEDRTMTKRRKAIGDEFNDSDEESKRSIMPDSPSSSGRGRGRGRGGRGRGRGRGRARGGGIGVSYKEHNAEIDSSSVVSIQSSNEPINNCCPESKAMQTENINVTSSTVETSNLENVGMEEKLEKASIATSSAADTTPSVDATSAGPEVKNEEYPGWSQSEMDKMAIDPLHFAHLNTTLNDEEDYDEEG